MTTTIKFSALRAITVGVVADTHIPDRVNALHPDLMAGLKAYNVDYIFHAGDISTPRVLDELGTVAPVYAVAGNRDFLHRQILPRHRKFTINGSQVLLTHGHIDAFHYWIDKLQNFMQDYQLDRYVKRLNQHAKEVGVYIFGHSHHAENRVVADRLFYNPGSASIAIGPEYRISFGIIRFEPGGSVAGEIIGLTGSMIRFGKWVQVNERVHTRGEM